MHFGALPPSAFVNRGPIVRGRPVTPFAPRPVFPARPMTVAARPMPVAMVRPSRGVAMGQLFKQRAEMLARRRGFANTAAMQAAAAQSASLRAELEALKAQIAAQSALTQMPTVTQMPVTTSAVYPTNAPVAPVSQQPNVSPTSPEADLTPTQDASNEAAAAAAPEPSSKKKWFIIGGVALAAVATVVIIKKRKKNKSPA